MQTVQLSDALTDFNLHRAWSKVYENQGCAGVDHQTLENFAEHLNRHLETLRNEVLYQTYRPLPLLRVDIEKPSGGKRPLSIPTVRDRVLQTAVTRLIEPLFEAEFEECSFAYRKGRSVEQAINRIQLLQRQGYQWVVDADIEGFFDNIDHALLLTQISQFISDAELLKLIKQCIYCFMIGYSAVCLNVISKHLKCRNCNSDWQTCLNPWKIRYVITGYVARTNKKLSSMGRDN